MIIIQNNVDVSNITRLVRRSDDYGHFDRVTVTKIFIKHFESIDINTQNDVRIVVNSNTHYEIRLKNQFPADDFIQTIIKSEIREEKINKILE